MGLGKDKPNSSRVFRECRVTSIMRMYVFVRKDLPEIYSMVQGAHAISQFALEYPDEFKKWGNSTIVFLKVKSEEYLNFINMGNFKYSMFWEPDLDNKLTIIASYTLDDFLKKLYFIN